MDLAEHLLLPNALKPRDFESNPQLTNQICCAIQEVAKSNDYRQLVLLIQRLAGTPFEQIVKSIGQGETTTENRLKNLCELIASTTPSAGTGASSPKAITR